MHCFCYCFVDSVKFIVCNMLSHHVCLKYNDDADGNQICQMFFFFIWQIFFLCFLLQPVHSRKRKSIKVCIRNCYRSIETFAPAAVFFFSDKFMVNVWHLNNTRKIWSKIEQIIFLSFLIKDLTLITSQVFFQQNPSRKKKFKYQNIIQKKNYIINRHVAYKHY